MLVFLEEGGGRRQVQTLSTRSLDVAETFPPNPDSLSQRQREGLESLRRDLARLVRRRTNWNRYTVSRGRDGIPDLERRRSSRQRGLSRDDAIHMIRVINREISGNLVTTSQTTRSAATDASSLFTSMMTPPVTSALRRSSTTIHPSSSTRTTTLRPVSLVTSPRPTTSRLTTSEQMMTQLREEEQKLIRLLQTTTSPTTSSSTDSGIISSLHEKERQLVQELANLERTTLLPSTTQVRQTLPPRESTLNETRNEIAKIKLDLQRVKNALLQRLRRGDLTNERNTQRRSEFSRLRNMEQSLTNRLQTLQTSLNQMITRDRRIRPITKRSRDEVMRSTEMIMNQQRSGTISNPVNQIDANTRLESVLQSLEKTLSGGEQLLLIRVLGEIERGVQINENNARISLLLEKLKSVMTNADFTSIRNLILGEQSNLSSTPIRNDPQNNSPSSVSSGHSSSTFHADDVDKIAHVVQTNLQPQEQDIIMRLFSSDHQSSSHLLQHPSVRPILQKLQQLLTFSEYKTFESLINGQTEPKQQTVPMESNVISNTNVQTQQPSPQLVQHLQHSPNNVQHLQQQNQQLQQMQQQQIQQQHMQQQQQMQQQHMQQLNALNNLSPSTSEFVGQQPMIQQQNQIPLQQSTHLAGQTGLHRMMNPAIAAQGLHGFGMNSMGLPMFPRLPSAMMQELMFGDTTDPPEIPTPTTAAPVIKETVGVPEIFTQALKVPAMDQKMPENIPNTTSNPIGHVGNHSVDFTSHLSNIMNVLKNSGMPKNVKLEFHLPQNNKKEETQKTQPTFEKKDGNSAILSNTLQMVQAPKIFPNKVGHNVQTDSNSHSKNNIVINNHQSQVFIPLQHHQENNSSTVRVQVHDTQPKNKPVFALTPSKEQVIVHNSMNGVHNHPQKTQFGAIRETPIVYQNQLPPGGRPFQNNIPQSNVIMKTSNLMKTKAEEVRPFPLRQPPKPQSVEDLEQFNKLNFQVPLKQLDSQPSTNEITSLNENERNRVPPRPSDSTFHIPNLPERNFIPLRKRFLSNLRNEMASPSDHERNRIPPRPSDSTFPVQSENNNNIISQPLREEPSNSILGPISPQKLSLLNNQKHVNLKHDKLPSLAKPVGFVNDKMESKSNTVLNQGPMNNQNIMNYNTDFASNTQAIGIPVTMPPQQLTSFSVPNTNQFLRKANEQTMKWDDVTSKRVETSANNQIKNIIMNAGGNVHTSFWDSLIEKTTNKSGSSSNHVIKINLDSNMLKSPLFNTPPTTTTTKNNNNNNVPNVEEEVEAEDIPTTTTTTTTTTMKPNEEFRMEIHTNQDGVSKISIIPQSNPSESKTPTTCSPSSEDFNCFGKSPFDSVKSIGTWCLAKCLQGSCIETVCSCSCDKKHHSSSYHSQVNNMASALSTGKNTDSGQIQSTLNEIYSSLRGTAQSSSNTHNVQAPMNGNNQNNQNNQNVNTQNNNNNNNPNSDTGDSMNVQFLLRSIEGMIENKLRMMAPRTTPKPEEEVEAEDLQKTPTNSNNWNNNENYNGNNGNNMNNNWNNNGNNNNGNDGNNNANNNWNNNGNNNNANNNWNNNGNTNNNNNWNSNGNNGNNWNNNGNNNGNWNNNQNSNWNNNGNSNGNNWNNNGNNNWNNNWQNGNNWQNNNPGSWQNGNWNNGPNNSGWNGPPPNWTQGPWNNGGGGGSWGGANNQWNNWGGSGNWNMAFSRRNPWQSNGGGEGGEAAD